MKNTGADSENDFELKLKRRYGKKCFIYRVTDSKEVRGRTGKAVSTKAQPSDYIVTEDGETYYAEVKSCNNATSFPFGQISEVQMGSSKRQYMAGGKYFFFLHNKITNVWYKVPACAIHNHNKRSFKWEEINNYKWEL
jgi:penicillin-binding protein-related factor A (putative recombinase)